MAMQVGLKPYAVDCQPGIVASVPCNLPDGQPCTDESGANQRQEPSPTETVIPCHGLLEVDRAASNG